MPHTTAFEAVRDAILALGEDDRKRLAAILEAAAAGRPDAGPLCDLLNAVARLERADQVRLGRWVKKYVNRWGQVPLASAKAASNAYHRRAN